MRQKKNGCCFFGGQTTGTDTSKIRLVFFFYIYNCSMNQLFIDFWINKHPCSRISLQTDVQYSGASAISVMTRRILYYVNLERLYKAEAFACSIFFERVCEYLLTRTD